MQLRDLPTFVPARRVAIRELHLFAGAGGGLLGSLLLGHRPVCAVEIDPYCRRVLAARRDEGWLPAEMEIHDDVTTFDGRPWRGRVDLVAGGFPCQDISVAGKGAGLEGARSGLFYELLRVVREVGPKWVYLENVPAITSRGLDRVLGALAELGFDAEWLVLSAADVGAPHLRKRWWCLARYTDGAGAEPAKPGVCQGAAADAGRGSEAAVEDSDGLRRKEHELRGADVSVRSGQDVPDTDAGQRSGTEHALRAGRDAADDGRADVPDTARRQGDGRGRGELACEAGAWRRGDAAAFAGGEDDPDADRRRQQVERQPQHDDEPSASWRQPDGLRSGGRRRGTAADAAHDGCVLGPRGDADQRTLVQAEQGTGAGDADRWSQPRGRCGGDRAGTADAEGARLEARDGRRAAQGSRPERRCQAVADAGPAERRLGHAPDGLAEWLDASAQGYWAGDWETEPRLAQGQTDRVARLRALGNGQVPQTAAMAFLILMQRYHQRGEA